MLRALRMMLVFTVLLGLLYPLAVTGVAAGLFPDKASGSMVTQNGQVMGSSLIGQPFQSPKYFWSRPSATSPGPDDPTASGGSNLGPTSKALSDAVAARVKALHDADPAAPAAVPVDLVTASASGLDPDISPAAAYYQVHRVAQARGLSESAVRDLVTSHIQGKTLGLLGEERVNVLQLNLDLDALKR